MENIVTMKNLTYQDIFEKLNLKIRKHQITFVTGPSGCGKTTLIKILSCLIGIPNEDMLDHTLIKENNIDLKEIGLVISPIEMPFLFKTVYQELAFPLENLTYSKKEIKKRIDEVINLLKLEETLYMDPNKLSTFEQSKLLIALAIIHKPQLLLLDDPCSNMNKKQTKNIMDILKQLQKKEKMTIVVATGNLDETIFGDYLYVLKQGKIILEGKPISVLQEEKILLRLGLKIPFMIDLSLKLKFYDLLDDVVLDLDKMVNQLWK